VTYVSHASAWEVGIKYNKPKPPLPYLAGRVEANGFRWPSIRLPTIYRAAASSRRHDDPFDRLIVAQRLRYDVPLISSGEQLDAYGIRRIW
jgi:PIN domain nuclease of toxin-antitoxin system